uniref:Defective in cullin neddylation protein n=1 Tax=Kalanchoe fedtschenkoi TaxID=63787 RepID=A0A7N0ZUI6_KALFE
MPRATRKSSKKSPLTSTNPYLIDATSASTRPSKRGKKGGIRLFDTYANRSSGLIDPEGIESLCSDLGVPHTDIKILILAWKMKSQRQGYFSQDEWVNCMTSFGVDTLDKLKKILPAFEKEARNVANFDDFYAFAFRYCLTEEKQKNLDIETVCALLDLVLGFQYPSQIDFFCQYLKDMMSNQPEKVTNGWQEHLFGNSP